MYVPSRFYVLHFPGRLQSSEACQSLILSLLAKDENKRLGSHHGASDIKQHAFFKDTHWACKYLSFEYALPNNGFGTSDVIVLRNVKPPLIPPPLDLASYELMIEKGYRLNNVGDEDETVLEETSLSKYDPFQNFASGRIAETYSRILYLGNVHFNCSPGIKGHLDLLWLLFIYFIYFA